MTLVSSTSRPLGKGTPWRIGSGARLDPRGVRRFNDVSGLRILFRAELPRMVGFPETVSTIELVCEI